MLGLDQQLHWGSFAFCFALPSQGSTAQTWERVRGAGAQGCHAPLDQHPAAELSLAPLPLAAHRCFSPPPCPADHDRAFVYVSRDLSVFHMWLVAARG